MATFTYTNSNSISDGGDFWDLGQGDPNTIVVAADAFVLNFTANLAPNFYEEGLHLLGGSYTATVDGTVGTGVGGLFSSGITFGSLTGLSKLTVGELGTVFGRIGVAAFHPTSITNAGYIQGESYAIQQSGSGNWSIKNSGDLLSLNGAAILIEGSGTHTIVNTGVLLSANWYSLLANADSIEIFTNSGEITGDLDFGSGNDTYTNFAIIKTKTSSTTLNGTVEGSIFMGEGDDVFKGGALHERVVDGGGKDTYKLGGGDDVFTSNGTNAGDGNVDTVDGGAGVDQYDAFSLSATANLRVNLDTIAHLDPVFGFTLAANTATDVGAGETGTDVVKNFENVISGSGNDSIWGSSVKNVFNGAEGDDNLFGLGGNDNLLGGDGVDDLFGGSGRDHLDGGGSDGAVDTFHYSKLADSLPGLKNRDFLGFFEDGFDRIDLSVLILGNATFIGVNTAFGADFNEVRVLTIGGGWVIQFDNADNKPDLAIEVDDLTHSIVWDASDFVL